MKSMAHWRSDRMYLPPRQPAERAWMRQRGTRLAANARQSTFSHGVDPVKKERNQRSQIRRKPLIGKRNQHGRLSLLSSRSLRSAVMLAWFWITIG
jgi:hypothetical protein